MALLSLHLCPEEGGIAQVPARTTGVKPHISIAMVPVGGEGEGVLHEVRRGGDLMVVSCAWRERPDGLGARDHLVEIVTGVPCKMKTIKAGKRRSDSCQKLFFGDLDFYVG